ncbi:zf-HC2 domain-containing protein [Streptomyces inhibens]|uniref:zf-HC2 domain-containing protein n=1 Tax=Streptomyces inhibens TaxID=2293571 RepID=UPI00379915E4
MKREQVGPGGPAWHADEAMGRRYADGSLPEPDAWSLEKHVEACGRCAAAVSAAVRATGTAGPLLEDVRGALLRTVAEEAPGEGGGATVRKRGARARRSPLRLSLSRRADFRPASASLPGRLARTVWAAGPALRGAWGVALLVVCAGAVALAYGAGFLAARSVFFALAPVLPLAGVALSYGPYADPMYEISAAAPSGGLRLLLIRTTAVLGVSLPLLTAVGALLPAPPGVPGAAAWLLPGLALTVGTLALGSYTGCRTAAALVATGWAFAVLLPAAAHAPNGAPAPAVLAEQLGRCVSGSSTQSGWAAAALCCAGLLALRRRAFDFAPDHGPGSYLNRLENS